MSPPIKSAIAGQSFNKDTYQAIFKLADQVYIANGGAVQPAVVAAIATPSTASVSDDATAQVAAVGRGRGNPRGGRGGRGNRGGGRGNGRGSYNNSQNNSSSSNTGSNNNPKPHQKGTKHPDLPSNASWACAQHWKKGRGAPYCSDPLVCQWVSIVAPRTNSA